MRRLSILLGSLLLSVSRIAGQAPAPGGIDRTLVDKRWEPKVGDRAVVDGTAGGAFLAADALAFDEMIRSIKAGDEAGVRQLAEKGRAARLADGAAVLVLEVRTSQFIASGTPALEVRVLDGPLKDRKGWVYAGDISRLMSRGEAAQVAAMDRGAGATVALGNPGEGPVRLAVAPGVFAKLAERMKEYPARNWVAQYLQDRTLYEVPAGSPAIVEAAGSPYYRVAVIGGRRAGVVGYVDERHVVGQPKGASTGPGPRIVKPEDVAGKPAPLDEKARARRAETLYQAGRNLEGDGKPGPALENYRRVVAEFPGTPAASQAGARIKALGGK